MSKIDTVAGIECMGYQGRHPTNLDTDPATLKPCPFCGQQAAYREGEKRGDTHPVAVECINSSCAVRTPKHYQNRETAAVAWNRRAETPKVGCRRKIVDEWWKFCGETDMGQTCPVLCTECGGTYRLAPQEGGVT